MYTRQRLHLLSCLQVRRRPFFREGSVREGTGGGAWAGSDDALAGSAGGASRCPGVVVRHSVPSVQTAAHPNSNYNGDKDEAEDEEEDDDDSAPTALPVSNTVQNQFSNAVPIRTTAPGQEKMSSTSHVSPTKSETSVAANNCRKKRLQLALAHPSGRFGIPDPDPEDGGSCLSPMLSPFSRISLSARLCVRASCTPPKSMP